METERLERDGSFYLPTLFKKSSSGKIQQWRIYVIPNSDHSTGFDIWTEHGQQGGKLQETVDSILEGKNIGKANETNPHQQAILEAKAKWTKQIERKGYVENLEDVDKDLRPGAEAMLAQRYDKYPEKIDFPCYLQPKLDGHRCIAVIKNDKCELFSRQRTPITGLSHINEFLVGFVRSSFPEDVMAKGITLDGELYNHDYKDNFEELTGFIRSQEPKHGYQVVQYHIYDVVCDLDYQDRLALLAKLASNYQGGPLHFVETHLALEETVVTQFREFRNAGYEGVMLRNKLGTYEGKRSYNLQKVKEFVDEEFEVIGVEEGRGKMKGHAIFVCKTSEGKEFKAKMRGSMDKLAEYFQNADQCIGKFITVMFQEYTKDGIPRFPVAIRFREDM